MKSFHSTVLKTGLIAGVLDGLAAIFHFRITGGPDAARIFQFIASGILGDDSFSGGWTTVAVGVLLHLFIAYFFTFFFFLIAPRISLLTANLPASAAGFGLFVWLIMNLAVVPLSRIPHRDITPRSAFIGISILIFCIGLPVSFSARNYFRKHSSEG